MSKFIKLTGRDDIERHINVDKIVSFFKEDNEPCTAAVIQEYAFIVYVKESPDEILALIRGEPLRDTLGDNKQVDDWIVWNGGECPVDYDTMVKYMCRGGDVITSTARYLRWEHVDSCCDVVKYRVLK